MPLNRKRIWLRALDYLWFHFITLIVAILKIRSYDIVFVPSPPITLGLSGYLLTKFFKSKLIYDVLEIWPDTPIRMGVIKNTMLVRLAYAVERFVYRHSSIVACISQSFINVLIQRGVPAGKLRLAPLFVDVDWMQPRPKRNEFAVKHGLQDKFVALYAGNIGLTQGAGIFVDIAAYFKDDKEIAVLIIGDGAGRPMLEAALAQAHLPNIFLLPFQNREIVPDIYATADVALSPLLPGYAYDTLPSKMYTAMAAGRPVIAACEHDTETAQLIAGSEGGMAVTPGSAQEMARPMVICKKREKARMMGQHARKWVVDHYSKNTVISMHDKIISEIA